MFFAQGTSADQDTRFSNKQAKLLKTQKFAPGLDHLVSSFVHSRSSFLDWSRIMFWGYSCYLQELALILGILWLGFVIGGHVKGQDGCDEALDRQAGH
jgi:hypothetical protein